MPANISKPNIFHDKQRFIHKNMKQSDFSLFVLAFLLSAFSLTRLFQKR